MQRSAELSETDPNPWALWLGLVSVSSQKHISKAERGRRMRFQILHGTKITTTLCSHCSAERSDVFDVETCSKSRFPPSSHTTIVALLLQSSSAFSGNPPRCYMKSVRGTGLLWWICLQTKLSVLQYSAILCIQSRHAAFAHMGAKCTNPSDSFVICGLRIMCLLLRNNDFFFSLFFESLSYFSHLWPLYFCSLWLRYFNTPGTICFSLSNLYLIIFFRHRTESKFIFRKRRAGSLNGRCDDEHDAPARHNFDFVLSEIPLNLSHVFLAAHSHAARAFFPGMMIDSSLIYMTEMIPCWCSPEASWRSEFTGPWWESECCVRPNSPPDVTICPSDCSLSAEWCAASTCLQSAFREGGGGIEKRAASPLQFSFNHHSSFHLFPQRVCMFIRMFCTCHSFFFLNSRHFRSLAEEMQFPHTHVWCVTLRQASSTAARNH